MKKEITLFIVSILFATHIVIAQENVLINGVKWATRNVAAPGTFAISPEDAGMFYQWNSKVGWPDTGDIGSTTWNSSWTGGYTTPSSIDTWTSANDPSPAGYHVPTLAQIKTLLDATKVTSTWTTQNGVTGRKYTDKASGNYIFVPASGNRSYFDGVLDYTGASGDYWSSTANSNHAYFFEFDNSYSDWNHYNNRALGLSIRPVAE